MRRILAVAAIILFVPAAARAALCTVSATGVAFGVYLPFFSAPTNSTGSVSVQCIGLNGPYTVALNAGLYSGGNFSNRRMESGSAYLSYQLYTDAANTIVWGDGSGGTATVSASCHGGTCSNTYTTYGNIPARQGAASPGSYSDVTTVTVSY